MAHHFTSNTQAETQDVIRLIRKAAVSPGNNAGLHQLIEWIGDARIVMLGEASHGTHEFYTWRSRISRKLIEEKGFNFIAVEGDWPDCYRLNRYIKNYPATSVTTVDVLKEFNRWPTWMWANWEIVELANWLKAFNQSLAANKRVGFYGLDVYSLWESMTSIMNYLQKTDPKTLRLAHEAYQCFEPFRKDEGHSYAKASQFVPELCQNEVVDLLKEIRRNLPGYNTDHENVFSAEQNAFVAVNAENYYRAMIKGGPHSWNVRDRHMMETLTRLLEFHGKKSKAIVWAHNTHIGDARATDMTLDGMFNIGELARIEYPGQTFLLGFGSFKGTVMAGRSWGAPMRATHMPPASNGSWEWLLHEAGNEDKLLLLRDVANDTLLENHFGHRAIGVVYNPEYERYGNYVPSILPLRYDAFVYLDETKALHPLHIPPKGLNVPETYPFGV
jgi:erythromycin esterase-like protein